MSEKNSRNVLSDFYENVPEDSRANYRWSIQRKCGWRSERTFYRKLKKPLRKLEIEAIRKFNRELANNEHNS